MYFHPFFKGFDKLRKMTGKNSPLHHDIFHEKQHKILSKAKQLLRKAIEQDEVSAPMQIFEKMLYFHTSSSPYADPATHINILNNLACCFRRLDRLDDSVTNLKKALAICKAHRLNSGSTLTNLTAVYSQKGLTLKALKTSQLAIRELHPLLLNNKTDENVRMLAIAYYNCGNQEYNVKDFYSSMVSYERGLKVLRSAQIGKWDGLTTKLSEARKRARLMYNSQKRLGGPGPKSRILDGDSEDRRPARSRPKPRSRRRSLTRGHNTLPSEQGPFGNGIHHQNDPGANHRKNTQERGSVFSNMSFGARKRPSSTTTKRSRQKKHHLTSDLDFHKTVIKKSKKKKKGSAVKNKRTRKKSRRGAGGASGAPGLGLPPTNTSRISANEMMGESSKFYEKGHKTLHLGQFRTMNLYMVNEFSAIDDMKRTDKIQFFTPIVPNRLSPYTTSKPKYHQRKTGLLKSRVSFYDGSATKSKLGGFRKNASSFTTQPRMVSGIGGVRNNQSGLVRPEKAYTNASKISHGGEFRARPIVLEEEGDGEGDYGGRNQSYFGEKGSPETQKRAIYIGENEADLMDDSWKEDSDEAIEDENGDSEGAVHFQSLDRAQTQNLNITRNNFIVGLQTFQGKPRTVNSTPKHRQQGGYKYSEGQGTPKQTESQNRYVVSDRQKSAPGNRYNTLDEVGEEYEDHQEAPTHPNHYQNPKNSNLSQTPKNHQNQNLIPQTKPPKPLYINNSDLKNISSNYFGPGAQNHKNPNLSQNDPNQGFSNPSNTQNPPNHLADSLRIENLNLKQQNSELLAALEREREINRINQLKQERQADLKLRHQEATKIQRSWRGHSKLREERRLIKKLESDGFILLKRCWTSIPIAGGGYSPSKLIIFEGVHNYHIEAKDVQTSEYRTLDLSKKSSKSDGLLNGGLAEKLTINGQNHLEFVDLVVPEVSLADENTEEPLIGPDVAEVGVVPENVEKPLFPTQKSLSEGELIQEVHDEMDGVGDGSGEEFVGLESAERAETDLTPLKDSEPKNELPGEEVVEDDQIMDADDAVTPALSGYKPKKAENEQQPVTPNSAKYDSQEEGLEPPYSQEDDEDLERLKNDALEALDETDQKEGNYSDIGDLAENELENDIDLEEPLIMDQADATAAEDVEFESNMNQTEPEIEEPLIPAESPKIEEEEGIEPIQEPEIEAPIFDNPPNPENEPKTELENFDFQNEKIEKQAELTEEELRTRHQKARLIQDYYKNNQKIRQNRKRRINPYKQLITLEDNQRYLVTVYGLPDSEEREVDCFGVTKKLVFHPFGISEYMVAKKAKEAGDDSQAVLSKKIIEDLEFDLEKRTMGFREEEAPDVDDIVDDFGEIDDSLNIDTNQFLDPNKETVGEEDDLGDAVAGLGGLDEEAMDAMDVGLGVGGSADFRGEGDNEGVEGVDGQEEGVGDVPEDLDLGDEIGGVDEEPLISDQEPEEEVAHDDDQDDKEANDDAPEVPLLGIDGGDGLEDGIPVEDFGQLEDTNENQFREAEEPIEDFENELQGEIEGEEKNFEVNEPEEDPGLDALPDEEIEPEFGNNEQLIADENPEIEDEQAQHHQEGNDPDLLFDFL